MRKILVIAFLMIGSSAFAAKPAPKTNPSYRAGPPRPQPSTLEPIIVKGTPPAPSVVYVLQKSSTKPAPLELKKSFVPKIVNSVPF